MKKVYVMTLNTAVNSGLKKALEDLGGTVVIGGIDTWFSLETHVADCEVVAVSLCEETKHTNRPRLYPNKYLRHMASFDDARAKGFPVHPTLASFLSDQTVTVLVIRTPSLQGLLAPLTQRLYTALEHFHNRDRNGRWQAIKPSGGRAARFKRSGVLNAEWNFCHCSASTNA